MMLAWCQCVWGSRGEVDSTVSPAAPKRGVKWASNQRMKAWQLLGAWHAPRTHRWLQELRPRSWGCWCGAAGVTAARMHTSCCALPVVRRKHGTGKCDMRAARQMTGQGHDITDSRPTTNRYKHSYLTPGRQGVVCPAVGVPRLHGGEVHGVDQGCVGDDVVWPHRQHLHHAVQLAPDAVPAHAMGVMQQYMHGYKLRLAQHKAGRMGAQVLLLVLRLLARAVIKHAQMGHARTQGVEAGADARLVLVLQEFGPHQLHHVHVEAFALPQHCTCTP